MDYVKDIKYLPDGEFMVKLKGNCRICGKLFEKEIKLKKEALIYNYPQKFEEVLSRKCVCDEELCKIAIGLTAG